MTDNLDELIPCPHSEAIQEPLADGFKLHHATRGEIAENHGVCAKCFQKFKRHNRQHLRGVLDSPVDPQAHHTPTPEDHMGFDVHGVTTTVDFDYAAVDGNTEPPEDEPNTVKTLADALGEILRWVWSEGSSTPSSAIVRFAALSAAVNPRLLDNNSYEEIGLRFGVSKACISKAALVFEKRFNFKSSRSRSASSRKSMAASMARSHARRHAATDAAQTLHDSLCRADEATTSTPRKESFGRPRG